MSWLEDSVPVAARFMVNTSFSALIFSALSWSFSASFLATCSRAWRFFGFLFDEISGHVGNDSVVWILGDNGGSVSQRIRKLQLGEPFNETFF